MTIRFCVFFALILAFTSAANAQHIEDAPKNFIGFLDVSARYGGELRWVEAAWVADGSPRRYQVSQSLPTGSVDESVVTQEIAATSFGTLETAYEMVSILVYRHHNGWVQILVDGELLWIRMEASDRFIPYENMISGDRLAYLLSRSVLIADRPGGISSVVNVEAEMQRKESLPGVAHWPDIEILGRAVFDDFETSYDANSFGRYGERHKKSVWFHIRIPKVSHCVGGIDPEEPPIAEGWIPAHDASGNVTVWYYSRGC